MGDHVCPWWMAYTFDNPLRRLFHSPKKILGEFVDAGSTVIDIGCGMGVFSIPMARMAGEGGRVIAVDLQPQMLKVLEKRARKAGVLERIETHLCESDDIGDHGPVDFALLFNVVHEVPSAKNLFQQVANILKPEARVLVAEPKMHVTPEAFARSVDAAIDTGLELLGEPKITLSRTALFCREDSPQAAA
jgi:2-polyprenyl-3-methyl-5-hydroxy-6-metoxy-1,4-benzoquinol methylase